MVFRLILWMAAAPAAGAGESWEQARAVCEEVASLELAESAYRHPAAEDLQELECFVWREQEGGTARKAQWKFQLGDHLAWSAEAVFDANEGLRFLRLQESVWGPAEEGKPGATADSVTEWSYFVSAAGKPVRSVEKSYGGEGQEALRLASEAAEERPLELQPLAAARLVREASALRRVNSGAAAHEAAKRLYAAHRWRGERDPEADREAWRVVELPEGTTYAKTLSAEGAAYEVVPLTGESTHGPEAPESVLSVPWEPAPEGTDAAVLLTLMGLQDDSVRGVRYRMDFTREESGAWKLVFC